FANVTLAVGANPVRFQATNDFGTTTTSLPVTVDNLPPSGALTVPAPNSTVTVEPGFVDVQWNDTGLAGLDPASFGTGDVTITGVTVDRIEDLGNGLVRYHYNDDNDMLALGPVQVTLVAGQVKDLAGNASAEAVLSFTREQPNRPPTTMPDNYTMGQGQTLTRDAAGGVLANDSDPDMDTLQATVSQQPAHGQLTLHLDGSFTYTPQASFSGEDFFLYQAGDGEAQ